jgi:predicted HTH transcriptional regulator
LADSLGKTRDGIKYYINKLQNLGILKRVGSDKDVHCEIVEEVL